MCCVCGKTGVCLTFMPNMCLNRLITEELAAACSILAVLIVEEKRIDLLPYSGPVSP